MIGSWLRFVVGLLMTAEILREVASGMVVSEILILLAAAYVLLSVMFFAKFFMK
jgi:hypothetical protein